MAIGCVANREIVELHQEIQIAFFRIEVLSHGGSEDIEPPNIIFATQLQHLRTVLFNQIDHNGILSQQIVSEPQSAIGIMKE